MITMIKSELTIQNRILKNFVYEAKYFSKK